jgi:hypothetical protein
MWVTPFFLNSATKDSGLSSAACCCTMGLFLRK